VNEDNLSNVRREASRHFRNKKREYLKDKITDIELNSKNKNIRDLYRGINGFKKGYQPRTTTLVLIPDLVYECEYITVLLNHGVQTDRF
jgi:hypothetical protein